MPVYNAAKFLRSAVHSVLSQSFKDFELLAINDGSTDNSLDILRSFDDLRLRIVDQSNAGVARTLNRGLDLARGSLILRHDADDTSTSDQLLEKVRFLDEHPEFCIVGSQIAFMTPRGKIAHDFRQPDDSYFQGQQFREVSRSDFSPYSPIVHATILARRDVLRELGGYRWQFVTSEDLDLWLRLIQQHRAAVIRSCSYNVRLSSSSATKRHEQLLEHYRTCAFTFFEARSREGVDPLMQGQSMPLPANQDERDVSEPAESQSRGKKVRSDVLDFLYPLAWNARDLQLFCRTGWTAVRDGWRSSATWRMLLHPVIGKRLFGILLNLKRRLRLVVPFSTRWHEH